MQKFQVSFIGLSTLFGKTSSLLLKQSPFIKCIKLYDETNIDPALDIAGLNTQCKVKAFLGKSQLHSALQDADIIVIGDDCGNAGSPSTDLFIETAPKVLDYAKAIAAAAPEAIVVVAASPLNSLVPLVNQTLVCHGCDNPNKVLGATSVDNIRANALLASHLNTDPLKVVLPVIGGSSEHTRVPIFSQAKPNTPLSKDVQEEITTNIKRGDGVIEKYKSHQESINKAFATMKLIDMIIAGLRGEANVTDITLAKTDVVPGVDYFAIPVTLGKEGIVRRYGMPKLDSYERDLIESAIEYMNKDIEKADMFISSTSVEKLNEVKETESDPEENDSELFNPFNPFRVKSNLIPALESESASKLPALPPIRNITPVEESDDYHKKVILCNELKELNLLSNTKTNPEMDNTKNEPGSLFKQYDQISKKSNVESKCTLTQNPTPESFNGLTESHSKPEINFEALKEGAIITPKDDFFEEKDIEFGKPMKIFEAKNSDSDMKTKDTLNSREVKGLPEAASNAEFNKLQEHDTKSSTIEFYKAKLQSAAMHDNKKEESSLSMLRNSLNKESSSKILANKKNRESFQESQNEKISNKRKNLANNVSSVTNDSKMNNETQVMKKQKTSEVNSNNELKLLFDSNETFSDKIKKNRKKAKQKSNLELYKNLLKNDSNMKHKTTFRGKNDKLEMKKESIQRMQDVNLKLKLAKLANSKMDPYKGTNKLIKIKKPDPSEDETSPAFRRPFEKLNVEGVRSLPKSSAVVLSEEISKAKPSNNAQQTTLMKDSEKLKLLEESKAKIIGQKLKQNNEMLEVVNKIHDPEEQENNPVNSMLVNESKPATSKIKNQFDMNRIELQSKLKHFKHFPKVDTTSIKMVNPPTQASNQKSNTKFSEDSKISKIPNKEKNIELKSKSKEKIENQNSLKPTNKIPLTDLQKVKAFAEENQSANQVSNFSKANTPNEEQKSLNKHNDSDMKTKPTQLQNHNKSSREDLTKGNARNGPSAVELQSTDPKNKETQLVPINSSNRNFTLVKGSSSNYMQESKEDANLKQSPHPPNINDNLMAQSLDIIQGWQKASNSQPQSKVIRSGEPKLESNSVPMREIVEKNKNDLYSFNKVRELNKISNQEAIAAVSRTHHSKNRLKQQIIKKSSELPTRPEANPSVKANIPKSIKAGGSLTKDEVDKISQAVKEAAQRMKPLFSKDVKEKGKSKESNKAISTDDKERIKKTEKMFPLPYNISFKEKEAMLNKDKEKGRGRYLSYIVDESRFKPESNSNRSVSNERQKNSQSKVNRSMDSYSKYVEKVPYYPVPLNKSESLQNVSLERNTFKQSKSATQVLNRERNSSKKQGGSPKGTRNISSVMGDNKKMYQYSSQNELSKKQEHSIGLKNLNSHLIFNDMVSQSKNNNAKKSESLTNLNKTHLNHSTAAETSNITSSDSFKSVGLSGISQYPSKNVHAHKSLSSSVSDMGLSINNNNNLLTIDAYYPMDKVSEGIYEYAKHLRMRYTSMLKQDKSKGSAEAVNQNLNESKKLNKQKSMDSMVTPNKYVPLSTMAFFNKRSHNSLAEFGIETGESDPQPTQHSNSKSTAMMSYKSGNDIIKSRLGILDKRASGHKIKTLNEIVTVPDRRQTLQETSASARAALRLQRGKPFHEIDELLPIGQSNLSTSKNYPNTTLQNKTKKPSINKTNLPSNINNVSKLQALEQRMEEKRKAAEIEKIERITKPLISKENTLDLINEKLFQKNSTFFNAKESITFGLSRNNFEKATSFKEHWNKPIDFAFKSDDKNKMKIKEMKERLSKDIYDSSMKIAAKAQALNSMKQTTKKQSNNKNVVYKLQPLTMATKAEVLKKMNDRLKDTYQPGKKLHVLKSNQMIKVPMKSDSMSGKNTRPEPTSEKSQNLLQKFSKGSKNLLNLKSFLGLLPFNRENDKGKQFECTKNDNLLKTKTNVRNYQTLSRRTNRKQHNLKQKSVSVPEFENVTTKRRGLASKSLNDYIYENTMEDTSKDIRQAYIRAPSALAFGKLNKYKIFQHKAIKREAKQIQKSKR